MPSPTPPARFSHASVRIAPGCASSQSDAAATAGTRRASHGQDCGRRSSADASSTGNTRISIHEPHDIGECGWNVRYTAHT